MLIRRRTYGLGFTSSYGYVMRNGDWLLCSGYDNSSTGTYLLHNIYTRMYMLEAPVGNFPASYRYGDRVNNMSFCVGYTAGPNCIIVATPKHIYKSTNKGTSWTTVCTLPTIAYWNTDFQPVLYASNETNYYLLFGELGSSSGGVKYFKVFHWNGSSGTTTNIKDTNGTNQYANFGNVTISNYTSGLYATKVSPVGQYVLALCDVSGSSAYYRYYIVSLTDKRVSNSTAVKTGSASISSSYLWAGQWYNDGSTYGCWFFEILEATNSTPTTKLKYYKMAGANIPTSGYLPTLVSIESELTTLKNKETTYQNPNMCVASRDNLHDNLLFWWINCNGNPILYYLFTSKSNLTNFLEVDKGAYDSDLPNGLKLNISGVFVGPDGRYGVCVADDDVVVVDLNARKCVDYYTASQLGESSGPYDGRQTSYMLPRYSL